MNGATGACKGFGSTAPSEPRRATVAVMEVLLVEDDDAIAEPLATGLQRHGFTVRRARDGAAALAAPTPDVVLLDLGLGDMDGMDVCRQLRSRSDVPIIIVTARGEETDRVVGLELGADDYVVKPFGFREVVARIRAVMRRAEPRSNVRAQRLGPLEIDRRARRVFRDGAELSLTPKEYDLLALLTEEPGTVYSRRGIFERVWGTSWYGPSRTLDVHIASLRRKLGDPSLIDTVRSVGFRFSEHDR